MRPAYLKFSACLALSAALAQPAIAQWRYSTSEDKMRGTSKSLPHVLSLNKVSFGFPYKGGSHMLLILTQRSGKGNVGVLLGIVPGQYHCLGGCFVSVKFDDGPVQTFRAGPTSDDSTDSISIGSPAAFLSKLKESSRLIVEAPFYQNATQQFEFDVSGLVLPPGMDQ